MDESDDARPGPSRADVAQSAAENPGPSQELPEDPRERFWAFLCRFAIYFHVLGYLVTSLLVLTVVGFLLWLAARSDLPNPGGSLALLVASFTLFAATGAGIWVLLRRCNEL